MYNLTSLNAFKYIMKNCVYIYCYFFRKELINKVKGSVSPRRGGVNGQKRIKVVEDLPNSKKITQ